MDETLDLNKIVVFDIETLINCFVACFYDVGTGKKKEFVIYNDDEYSSQAHDMNVFFEQLKQNNYTLISFNGLNFDAQVIEDFKRTCYSCGSVQEIIDNIYSKAQELINIPEEERFKILLPEWKLTNRHIDLFKQKHYDGKAKRGTSLKWLQFSMGYENIEEMPIAHDSQVDKSDIPMVVEYCWNDVMSTYDFFKKIKSDTELRDALSKEYDLNLLNASEPRLVREIFGKYLCNELGITYKELRELKTFRKIVKFKDIIFPYTSYYTEPFKDLLRHFNSIEIDASPYSTEKFEYHFTYKDVKIDLGLGGIHGCNKPAIYKDDEEFMILDVDVKSYYPNLAIRNGIQPEQFNFKGIEGKPFLRVYENLYDERLLLPKSNPKNTIIKLILNSCYGLSKEVNSYLYDPLFTYSITINGQLTILMLTEMLGEYIKDLELIQLNTDGITVKFRRKDYDRVVKICNQFEKVTKQVLEYAEYSKMIIRDVNNYMAISTKGDIKKKGCFETEMDYHKNPSFIVIPKAIEAYYKDGIDYKDYINSCNNLLDFCGGVKKKRDFDINLYTTKGGITQRETQQKVTRYYISNDGGALVKDFHDGRQVSIASRQKAITLNRLKDQEKHLLNVNRQWYIKGVERIINEIESNKQQLKLF